MGLKTADSTKFFTPFGEYHIQPTYLTYEITDRGFTGHRHNIVKKMKKIIWYVLILSGLLVGCTAEKQNIIKRWSVPDGVSHWAAVTFSPDQKLYAYITNEEGSIQVWHLPRNRLLYTFPYNKDYPATLAFSPDSKLLAASTSREVQIWDIERNQISKTLSPPRLSYKVGTISFSPNGSLLALNAGGYLSVWNIQSGEFVTSVDLNSEGFITGRITFSPDGNLIALDMGSLYIWDVENNELVGQIPERPNTFTFSEDNSELVSTSGNTVSRWQMPNGELIDNFTLDGRSLLSVLPPNANFVLAITLENIDRVANDEKDNSLLFDFSLWSVKEKKMLWREPTEEIERLEFEYLVASPTGDHFAMVSFNNGFRIWEVIQ